MALEIIGAGFGRTGTLGLKKVLEQLGFNQCYHMMEVRHHPEHPARWTAAASDPTTVDWNDLFQGYRAAVDWPACYFWESLAKYYPKAKVILTVRDSESWYRSASSTIFKAMALEPTEPWARAQRQMARELILQRTFGGRATDESYARQVFERHNEQVIETLGRERCLIYNVSEGWEPLCQFLGVSAPADEFPHINTTAEFRRRVLTQD